jgi:cephalosporin-C deacetylase-like acetyl esterase
MTCHIGFTASRIISQLIFSVTKILAPRTRVAILATVVLVLWQFAVVPLTRSDVQAAPLTTDEASRLFDYDRSVALDLREVSKDEQEGVTIRDVNYASYNPKHRRIDAYLIQPKGNGPFAGVLFFHWLGNVKSDRTEFLDEAMALAKQGTAALLIQGNFPWLEAPTEGQSDRQQVIDQTIEVRRALDLLLAQPKVDPRRIAFVGHDYGAMYGGIVAGVDKRVKTYVFMAAMGNFSDWSLKYWPVTATKGEATYRQAMNDVEPINHISRATADAFLFQFSNTDKFIPKETALAYSNAAKKRKEVKWYDSLHDLNVAVAMQDRREWLTRELRLRNPMPN